MKNKSRIYISLFVVVSVCLIFSVIYIVYYQNYGKYYPKNVFTKPDGYVLLNDAVDENKDNIQYKFSETAVFFMDKQNNSLGTWNVRNSDFIVRYNGKYYINERKLDEMLGEQS